MDIINGEEVKSDTSSTITYRRHPRRDRRHFHKYVPDEIWLEILSRLSFKSLFKCRSVCKSWRNIFVILQKKTSTDASYVPLCGIVFVSINFDRDPREWESYYSYFCLTTKENFSVLQDTHNFIYPSGFETRLVSDLSFDFSIIREMAPAVLSDRFISFELHEGLLLAAFGDGTFQVHNPATKQIYSVPKSRFVEKYSLQHHFPAEKTGLIVQFPTNLTEQWCHFIVVRFCISLRIMEVYYTRTRRWRQYRLNLDELQCSVRWRVVSYVAFYKSGVLYLYVLTRKDYGIAIKFKDSPSFDITQYSFRLPDVIPGEKQEAKIWECEKTLHLSYYNDTSLWIWKARSTRVDAWEWVPIFEISPARQLCKPIARARLSGVILNSNDRVMPIAFHPDVVVVFLLVKSSLFSYNLDTDTLNDLGELKDLDDMTIVIARTYKPCLSFMDVSKTGN